MADDFWANISPRRGVSWVVRVATPAPVNVAQYNTRKSTIGCCCLGPTKVVKHVELIKGISNFASQRGAWHHSQIDDWSVLQHR